MQGENFVFFGIAGSGKGTQVKLLQEFLKSKDGKECVYVYPGSEYRKLMDSGTYAGSLVKGPVSRGELLPGFLTTTIVVNILISSLTPEKHLLVDGYPRAVDQSQSFEETLKFFERGNVKIIYIEVSKEEATKRNLLRGRHDDQEEGLKRRFDEYINNVVPAMNYFKDKPNYKIYTINGEQTIEQVHQDIVKALGY